ncbi:MAG TPA: T9SS type A sorting domain-containing protein [Bacteroidia bacterium]|nr:T9SS type A sorting domain-containing protein [Bacteroidia bacterium]
MKKIFLFVSSLFFYSSVFSQTLVFHENMENIDSLISSGSPGWFVNTHLQTSGSQSDSSSVVPGGISILETLPIDFTGYTFIVFNFHHICKTSFFDQAIVEVFDGTAWIQLTAQNMMPAQADSASFDGQQNNFSEAIYIDWLAGQIVSPDNSWWKTEAFDISAIAANVPNAKIRWKLADQNLPGGDSRAGWFIDDISVNAAPCELFPPSLVQLAPVIQNSALSLGPYTLNINLTDASGIDTPSVALIYTINSGVPDTVSMTNTTGNIFSGIIPAVADSDTVCYYFYARDNSPCHNPVQYPAAGCISFIARTGLVISFCDDFDLNNFWTSTTVSGSSWQYGTPTGSPASPHSPPNLWEVALGAQYLGNTICYLTSPDISFLNVINAKADLWFFSDCESAWDGTRLEYSTNSGVTWNVLGNVGTGINWYNQASVISSNLPGWSGNFGWTNATHTLAALNNEPVVRFRFVFTADAIIELNGFAVDDFCLFSTTAVSENDLSQENLSLDPNIPNPFNHKTTISYSIPETGLVEIFVSDLTGKKIASPVKEIQKKGIHKIEIESSHLSPGIYFYSIKFKGRILTKKMILVE